MTLKLASRAGSDVFLKGMMCDHRSEPPLWSGGCRCHHDDHAEVRDRAERRAAGGGRGRTAGSESGGEILTGFGYYWFNPVVTHYYWVTTGFHLI
jgi:hypothetical protein